MNFLRTGTRFASQNLFLGRFCDDRKTENVIIVLELGFEKSFFNSSRFWMSSQNFSQNWYKPVFSVSGISSDQTLFLYLIPLNPGFSVSRPTNRPSENG